MAGPLVKTAVLLGVVCGAVADGSYASRGGNFGGGAVGGGFSGGAGGFVGGGNIIGEEEQVLGEAASSEEAEAMAASAVAESKQVTSLDTVCSLQAAPATPEVLSEVMVEMLEVSSEVEALSEAPV
ncbi:keratin, type I cytoskeletal 13-like [Penaeus chinensis]|uniref:keratin, type I cytoskeletal 13-like n=1 Tax=Penaeus chinensis TaxID=139456 RepID=UPI001FB81677|nr:keratin, type I cytoskeletal 13-like [Penaeus chinensis]